jgi:hypothetical protein
MPADTPPASYPAPPAGLDIDLQQQKANLVLRIPLDKKKRWFPDPKSFLIKPDPARTLSF